MRRYFFILLFGMVSLGAWGFSQPSVHHLQNGTAVVIVNDPSATVSSSYVFIRSGSLFEGQWLGTLNVTLFGTSFSRWNNNQKN